MFWGIVFGVVFYCLLSIALVGCSAAVAIKVQCEGQGATVCRFESTREGSVTP